MERSPWTTPALLLLCCWLLPVGALVASESSHIDPSKAPNSSVARTVDLDDTLVVGSSGTVVSNRGQTTGDCPGTTWYVSVDGDNDNLGTFDEPWATPGYGSRQLSPGDSLVILGGRYLLSQFDDDIITPPSGTAGAWITIRGETRNRPQLAGRDNLLTAVNLAGCSYLRLENLEITHDNQAAGDGLWFREAISLIGAPGSHIELRDLYIHHLDEFGIDIQDVDDLLVRDCRIEYCGFGAMGGPEGSAGGWRNVRIEDCRLSWSGHYYRGGDGSDRPYDRPDGFGIEPADGPIEIIDTWAEHNYGDGLDSKAANTTISNCMVAFNTCDGVKLWDGGCRIENTLIYGRGDGDPTPTPWSAVVIGSTTNGAEFLLENVTVADTLGQNYIMHVQYDHPAVPVDLTLRNCIFHGTGPSSGIYVSEASILTAEYNLFHLPATDYVIQHGSTYHTASTIGDLGPGNLYGDPLFATGSTGDHFLGQTASGQTADSPALDAGDPAVSMVIGTTRTDLVQDAGTIDMGYHYPLEGSAPPQPFLLVGPGPSPTNPPRVRLIPPEEDAAYSAELAAYGATSYGVNVAAGDLDGDGRDEILTGAGPGEVYGPHVRGFTFDATSHSVEPLPGVSFLAYGTPRWGVNVATGDLDGDGRDEIITGAGPGAVFGPHVRGFEYDSVTPAVTPMAGVNFFAYGTLRWGVNVATGDLDGDGRDEIITGAGPGPVFGPHVRGFTYDPLSAITTPLAGVNFFAYGTPRWGVVVTAGDVDGDGIDEIITAPGPSSTFASHIRGWNYDGAELTPIPGFNFFAWPPEQFRYGARISSGVDLTGDGRTELVVSPGPDPAAGSPVIVFAFDDKTVSQLISLQVFPNGWTHGVTVSAGRF